MPSTSAQNFARADTVFTGTAVSRTPAATSGPVDLGPVVWTFRVDRVIKGVPADSLNITATMPGISCGIGFELGRRYDVFATENNGSLWPGTGSRISTGNLPLIARIRAELKESGPRFAEVITARP